MSIQPRGGRFKGDFFTITLNFTGIPNTTQQFAPIYGSTFSGTETNVDVTNDLPFTIRRLRVVTTDNSVTGNTVVEFRRNAATVTSRTVATTVVGETATGILSIPILEGDLINWALTVTDGAANVVSGMGYLVCQRTIE